MTLTLPAAWPTGTVIVAVNNAGVALAGVTATLNAARTQVVLDATTAAGAAALANGAYVFAQFNGLTAIPQTSSVVSEAAIVKAPAAPTTQFAEQNNVCAGTFTGIGGGVKIDVRNYASFATFGATGPQSVVRLINNSESQKADVFAQLIYADGRYGPWGRLADLAPRAVQNYSNKEIEAALTTAAAAANPFGASTVYTNATGATPVASNGGDRLRIVSNSGTTLRVQSFMVMPNGMILDTSQAQGVDFENTTNSRSPDNAVDAQPNSQDAINGLGR